jgi:hypothetical protein
MFSQLFRRSDALARQMSAPLVYERDQYLNHCAAQGMSRKTLRGKARFILSIAECFRLADRPDDIISLAEIERRHYGSEPAPRVGLNSEQHLLQRSAAFGLSASNSAISRAFRSQNSW